MGSLAPVPIAMEMHLSIALTCSICVGFVCHTKDFTTAHSESQHKYSAYSLLPVSPTRILHLMPISLVNPCFFSSSIVAEAFGTSAHALDSSSNWGGPKSID